MLRGAHVMHNCGYDFLNTHIDRIIYIYLYFSTLPTYSLFWYKGAPNIQGRSGPTVTLCFAYRNRLERNRLHGSWNDMEWPRLAWNKTSDSLWFHPPFFFDLKSSQGKIGWTSAYQVDYFLQNPTGPRRFSHIDSNPHLGSQQNPGTILSVAVAKTKRWL